MGVLGLGACAAAVPGEVVDRLCLEVLLEALVRDESVLSLVAEREGEVGVRGFLFAAVRSTPPVYDAGGDTATIDDFVVSSPDAWLTVGTALLDAAKARLREQGAAQIVVVCGQQDVAKRRALAHAGLSVASEWYVGDLRAPHGA